jgi:hypothetical protein
MRSPGCIQPGSMLEVLRFKWVLLLLLFPLCDLVHQAEVWADRRKEILLTRFGVWTQLRVIFIVASMFTISYCIDVSLYCFSRNNETFLQLCGCSP